MPARPRSLAVDWSGAALGARRRIALAEATGGRLVRVELGRDRDEVIEHLIAEAQARPELVVGLDFAFSLPAWFLRERGLASAAELWELVAREGERWLAECDPPFWGRPGRRRPALAGNAFRRTEGERPPLHGIGPKSVFQIGGAGAVGTGSLRGMPYLARLRAAGFAIWPFDPSRPPVAIEIYPRYLTGPLSKRDALARKLYAARRLAAQPAELARRAVESEDALDAAVSALAMDAEAPSILALPPARDERERLEGRIWTPAEPALPPFP